MAEPNAIAARLSKAQRKLIRALSCREKTWRAVLRDAKLKAWPGLPGSLYSWGGGHIYLTATGAAVRDELVRLRK